MGLFHFSLVSQKRRSCSAAPALFAAQHTVNDLIVSQGFRFRRLEREGAAGWIAAHPMLNEESFNSLAGRQNAGVCSSYFTDLHRRPDVKHLEAELGVHEEVLGLYVAVGDP